MPRFKWSEVASEHVASKVSKLICEYQGNHYFFIFDVNDDGDFFAKYFPSEKLVPADIEYLEWEEQLDHISIWADRLKRELEEPDLWSELAAIQSGFSFEAPHGYINTLISAGEAKRLKEGIRLFETRITKDFHLNKDQYDFVRTKLNYLSEAIERQGRTDWIYTAIGVFASIGMAIGISAANSDKFWTLIKETLGTVFRLLIAQ